MHPDPLQNLQAATIDGVLLSLDRVIEWAKQNSSRLGYFAALYRKVTRAVKQGIADGSFADGPRMERLDVIFANRYLDALERYQSDRESTPRAWRLAFETAEQWWPIVLQHLLLGMNAHINMDLGIAAVACVPPGALAGVKSDFFKINAILAALVQETQEELTEVWPLLRLLDRFVGESDEGLANVGMWLTRGHAWLLAEELALLPPDAQAGRIARLDQEIAVLGALLVPPGRLLRFFLLLVRIGELRFVPTIIEILE
ncbi:MAG: hypothetical protein DWI57_00485 [Chloroflexi bacterium]|nr:MAG: hypothetical protein DWI57_00485 [Chloroflexota bacterium]